MKLLKTRKVGVTASLDEGAKLVLNGDVKLKVHHHHKPRTRLVPVFTPATAGFGCPGSKNVELALSHKGRKALAHLRKATLVITGAATALGKATTRQATTTLRR